jgi:hypothetical protein
MNQEDALLVMYKRKDCAGSVTTPHINQEKGTTLVLSVVSLFTMEKNRNTRRDFKVTFSR